MVPTVLAAAGIVAGVFGPILRAGVEVEGLGGLGSIQPTYYGLFGNQGNVLLALCAVALVLALRGMGKWVWVSAVGVWITLVPTENAVRPSMVMIPLSTSDSIALSRSRCAGE